MTKYIVNGTLIDGTGCAPVPLRWLSFGDDGRIMHVETAPDALMPAGAEIVFDADGLTVMPGLVDAHCHLTYGDVRTEEEQDLYSSAEYRALRAAWNAHKVLKAGVTSISDPGGSWNVGVAVRDAITAGMFPGPRMSVAGRFLTTHTGLADFYPTWVGAPVSSVGTLTNRVEEMLTEIRAQAKNGVDFIKVAASGESPTLTPGGGSVPAFRKDQLQVIVDEAHRLNKRVTAHARSGVVISDCIDVGMDWLMHGDYMTREHADKLAESQIPLCPTLTLIANIVDFGHLVGVAPTRIERSKRQLEQAVGILSYAHKAGVRMLCGTDSGFAVTPYGEWHARELELLVRHVGLSPMEAIVAGTSGAAMTVAPAEVGILQKGRMADALVLDGDPLKDIRILQERARLRAVFKEGKSVDLSPSPVSVTRWAWENAQVFSRDILRWSTVHGKPATSPSHA